MYVLVTTKTPEHGAGFGKSTVSGYVVHRGMAADLAIDVLTATGMHLMTATHFAHRELWETSFGTDVTEPTTGLTFRIADASTAPNVCPCCGRLVEFDSHAYGGQEGAYCTGCYTWGDSKAIKCAPANTAHANPWTYNTAGARFCLSVVVSHDGETGEDNKYSADDSVREMWDETENALIAWPGLTEGQILEATITEIPKEN